MEGRSAPGNPLRQLAFHGGWTVSEPSTRANFPFSNSYFSLHEAGDGVNLRRIRIGTSQLES
jgi:hypothetical protein